MKTIPTAMFALALSAGIPTPAAAAGDDIDGKHIEILDVNLSKCSLPHALCLNAGAATTLAVPGAVHKGLSLSFDNVAPRFTRTVSVAGYQTTARIDDSVPWTIELDGQLQKPAVAGNALFLVYDADDKQALAKHEVIAGWQAPIPGGDRVAARLTFNIDDGFRANHTYLIRVVQLLNGKENLLSKAKVHLD